FGREGGREGMYEYLRPAFEKKLPRYEVGELSSPPSAAALGEGGATVSGAAVDRTAKVYVGGVQKRPDGEYSYPVLSPKGERVGEAPMSNRKDVRDAVEAALKGEKWRSMTAHARAQVVYYV